MSEFISRDEKGALPVVPIVLAGLIAGTLSIIFSISFSALVFKGDLAVHVPVGVGLALLGTLILSIIIPLIATYPGTVGGLIAEPAIILGIIAMDLSETVSQEQILPTILVAIMLAGILTGAALYCVGFFQLGKVGQYVPYTVIGGFLAGLGIILVQGAISFVLPMSLTLENISKIMIDEQSWKALLVIVIGIIIFAAQRMKPSSYNIPIILFAGAVLFWGVSIGYGFSVSQIREAGWLLGPFPEEGFWSPAQNIDALGRADWMALITESPKFLTIFLLVLVSSLMVASSLELAVRQDIDPNRELKAVGISNFVCGLFGGFMGTAAISATALNRKMGVSYRLVGLVAATAVLIVFLAGADVISFVPGFVIAGLLLYIGIDFLYEWLVTTYSQVSRLDYAGICLVFLAVALIGFMEGFIVGLILGFIFFVLTYSRVPVVQFAANGAEHFSNMEHAEHEREYLREMGLRDYIMKLQGFIFFGTASRIVDQVRDRMNDDEQPKLSYLILDFMRVDGLDSSGMVSFQKILQYAESGDFVLVLCHCDEPVVNLFRQYDVWDGNTDFIVMHPDLDRALDWVERRYLLERFGQEEREEKPFEGYLAAHDQCDCLLTYCDKMEVEEGDYLCRQGDPSNDLFLIQDGEVSVYLEANGAKKVRLKKYLRGSIVGEIAMFLRQPRTASVIADEPLTVYKLSREGLDRLQVERPEVLAAFLEGLLKMTQSHLLDSNRLVNTLLD